MNTILFLLISFSIILAIFMRRNARRNSSTSRRVSPRGNSSRSARSGNYGDDGGYVGSTGDSDGGGGDGGD